MVPITIVFMGFINHLITGPHIDMPMMLGFSPCRDRDHPGITKTKPGPPGRPGLYVRRSVTGSDWSSLTLDWSRVEPHIPWRIHGAAIYGNMDPINVSPMLAYIPAPWILWDMAGKIAMPFFSTSLGPWVAVTIRDLEEAVFVFFPCFSKVPGSRNWSTMLVTQPMWNTEDLKLLFWLPVVIYFQSYTWRGQMLLDQDCLRVDIFGHRHIWVPCSHPWFLHGACISYKKSDDCVLYMVSCHMEVSQLGGYYTPESFMYEWISTINHPFWGTSIYGNLHMLYLFLLDSSIVTEMEQSEFDWSSLSVSRPDFKATWNTPHKPWFSMGFTHLWSILWHFFEDVWYQQGIIGHIH